MVITVDLRFDEEVTNNYQTFVVNVFRHLALQHPEHRFLFFVNDLPFAPISFPESSFTITCKPAQFLTGWRQSFIISKALKRHKADVFISSGTLISLLTKVPRVLLISQLPNTAGTRGHSFLYDKILSFCIKKANAVCTPFNFLKQQIIADYKKTSEQITVTGIAADEIFKPISWQRKEEIKEQYTQGCEYFLLPAVQPENLLTVLKAFSVFKKWQRSNMKLVILEKLNADVEKNLKLATYKYRDEIIILYSIGQPVLANIVAAAYAVVFRGDAESFAFQVAEALQCQVPAIIPENSNLHKIAGEAALLVKGDSPESMAEQMKHIYKDEQLRNDMITAGTKQAKMFDLNEAAGKMWKVIGKAVSK